MAESMKIRGRGRLERGSRGGRRRSRSAALPLLAAALLCAGLAGAAPVLSLPEENVQTQGAGAQAVAAGLRALQDRAWETAQASFEEALRLEPRSWAATLGMAELAAQRGEPVAAVERWLDKARSLQPQHPVVLRAIASWDLRQGRLPAAIEALRKAAAAAPSDLQIKLELGEALLAQRDGVAAEAAFRSVLAAEATQAGALTGLALALVSQGKDSEALQAFEHAARKAPKDPRALLALARYQASKRRIDDAIGTLERLSAVVPDAPEAYLDKGDLLVMKNDTAGAVEAYRRASGLGGAAVSVAEFRLGALFEAQGRADEAEAAYRRVLQAQPDSYAALNNLAMLLVTRSRDGRQAIALARKAVALAPGRPQAHDTLAWALRADGKADEALASVERALAIDPKPATYAYHKGVILAQLGRKAQARASLEAALKSAPQAAWAAAAKELLARL